MKRAASRAIKESFYICDFEDIIIQSKATPQLIPSFRGTHIRVFSGGWFNCCIPILLKLMFDTIPINIPIRTFVDIKLHYNLHGGQNN